MLGEENQVESKERDQILSWLSRLNFWHKQNDYFSGRQQGTGEWLLDVQEFKDWIQGTTGVLWCHGIRTSRLLGNAYILEAGAGKTILAYVIFLVQSIN